MTSTVVIFYHSFRMGDHKNEEVNGQLSYEDINHLRRFLCLGFETGYCHVEPEKEKDRQKERMAKDQADSVLRLIQDGKGEAVVEEIVKFSDGRTARQNPIVFALAMCAHLTKDLKTVRAAYKALSDVCKIPTQLFMFVKYSEKLKNTSGWGSGQRKAIYRWYNEKEPLDLAMMCTKYIQRNGWSHTDVLRLAHVKPKNDTIAAILMYVTKGFAKVKEKYKKEDSDDMKSVLEFLEGVHTVKHERDEQVAARLIEKYRLCREHVPTWHSKSQDVWRALVPHMPITALLRNLGKLSSLKLLDTTEKICSPLVIEKLKNADSVKAERVHPFTILRALKAYELGKGTKGKKKWLPNPKIVEALDTAFYDSFSSITPTGKRFLLAIDISKSMQYGGVTGSSCIKPADTVAAMAMATARSEKDYKMLAFGKDQLVEVDLMPSMKLRDIERKISTIEEGCINCCKPIQWALEKKLSFDVIVIYSDSDNFPGFEMPVGLLRQYRRDMNIPEAKMIVCTLSGSSMPVADPDDCGMLDIAGFDSNTPSIISSFVNGDL